MKESPIFTRTYDLLRWVVPATLKFPRQQRFVVASAIQKAAFDLQDRLLEAVAGGSPAASLAQADVALARLRVYLRLSHDLQLLSTGRYEHVGRMVEEVGRLLGAWRKKVTAPKAG